MTAVASGAFLGFIDIGNPQAVNSLVEYIFSTCFLTEPQHLTQAVYAIVYIEIPSTTKLIAMAKYGIDSKSDHETGKFMAIVRSENGEELWRSNAFLDNHDQAIWLSVRWLENHIKKEMPPHLQQKISELLKHSVC